jgi:hypothetical protein
MERGPLLTPGAPAVTIQTLVRASAVLLIVIVLGIVVVSA